MPFNILSDNWTLQEIANLYANGISSENGKRIEIDKKHSFKAIPDAAIQVETLLSFLVDIVLCDNLILDSDYANVWRNKEVKLETLENSNLILYEKFDPEHKTFDQERDQIIQAFNLPKSLIKVMDKNRKSWREEKKAAYPHESSLIWGTAGNLNRGNIVKSPYSPHPCRKYFLQQANFYYKNNASEIIRNTIQDKRIELIQKLQSEFKFQVLKINIDPIAIEIIESSNSVEDLIEVALQMRGKYKKLINYISKFQDAIDTGDIKILNDYSDTIKSVTNNLLGVDEGSKYGETNISLGIGILNISRSIKDRTINKFGVRGMLQELLLKKSSAGTIKKLLLLFDEKNPVITQGVIEHFKIR